MLRVSRLDLFRMSMGNMFVDYKLLSRDHQRSVRVEGAKVDTKLPRTCAPMHWLEALRSPSAALPSGFFVEKECYVQPPGGGSSDSEGKPNAVLAGPVVMYIVGQIQPVVLDMHFVDEEAFGMRGAEDCDLRIGLDAIEQCSLMAEMRPGGLLSSKSIQELKTYGMKTDSVAESPLVPRPWTKMKYMFIDELQRGPQMTEFVGHNPRVGSPWRFSQHNKYYRIGIWREITRKKDMHIGHHNFSSFQKSPQQAVPEVRFMAPGP